MLQHVVHMVVTGLLKVNVRRGLVLEWNMAERL